jgi:hypothetical protein
VRSPGSGAASPPTHPRWLDVTSRMGALALLVIAHPPILARLTEATHQRRHRCRIWAGRWSVVVSNEVMISSLFCARLF